MTLSLALCAVALRTPRVGEQPQFSSDLGLRPIPESPVLCGTLLALLRRA